MLERLFRKRWTEKREFYSFILGIIIPIIAAIASSLVFRTVPSFIGIGTLMFCVILAMPTINKLFEAEERKEVHSKANFFHKHNHIIDSFLYFFFGTFVSFFMIGLFFPNAIFTSETLFGPKILVEETALPQLPVFEQAAPTIQQQIFSVLLNNAIIVLVCFLLSLIFGAGSILLIVLNSSVFASAFLALVASSQGSILHKIAFIGCQLGVLITHGFPEVLAYLIAAIGGGVLSQAIIKEKFMSKRFKIVLEDSVLLLAISIAILSIAALLEILISKRLYEAAFCATHWALWIIVGIILVKIVIIFELVRQKHKKKVI